MGQLSEVVAPALSEASKLHRRIRFWLGAFIVSEPYREGRG